MKNTKTLVLLAVVNFALLVFQIAQMRPIEAQRSRRQVRAAATAKSWVMRRYCSAPAAGVH